MDLTNITTSGEAKKALESDRATLAQLQNEPDNATWIASQDERNRLELRTRELVQLQQRLEKQEEEARLVSLREEIAEGDRLLASYNEAEEQLVAFVEQTVDRAATLLADLHKVVNENTDRASRLMRLEREAGIRPSFRHVRSVHAIIGELQQSVWKRLSAARVPSHIGLELPEIVTPRALPEGDLWHVGVAHRQEAKAAETPTAPVATHDEDFPVGRPLRNPATGRVIMEEAQ